MKTSFVTFQSTDSIQLHGLLFQSEGFNKSIVIHIHGMAGNFYENSFIAEMAKSYTSNGIAFLTYNNRGHDYYCDLLHVDTGETCLGGAAYEIFEECVFDIEGAILFAKSLGYTEIVLQGHSSGANKAVYYLSKQKSGIHGVALLSPCDDIGLHIDDLGDNRVSELLNHARELISSGSPDQFMPPKTFFDYLLSAKTYFDCFQPGSALDAFPYRDPQNAFVLFGSVQIPIFISFGNNGDYLLQNPEDVAMLLNLKKSINASLSFNVIDGASHSYTGKEKELVTALVKWIKDLG